jgi:hypothetical protein
VERIFREGKNWVWRMGRLFLVGFGLRDLFLGKKGFFGRMINWVYLTFFLFFFK